MEYDYDIREVFDKYLKGETSLSNYMDMFNYQEAIYPQNYDKMRCLENHDQPRICHYVKNRSDLENYTAFLYFLKGSTLIYAGQEFGCDETPSLFDKDVFPRNTGIDLSNLLQSSIQSRKPFLMMTIILRLMQTMKTILQFLSVTTTRAKKSAFSALNQSRQM